MSLKSVLLSLFGLNKTCSLCGEESGVDSMCKPCHQAMVQDIYSPPWLVAAKKEAYARFIEKSVDDA